MKTRSIVNRLLTIIAVGLLANLTMLSASAQTPVPEQPWIVYQGYERIRLVRADGSEGHVLTPDWTGGPQFHPDWSPDDRQIAFSADETDGTRDIWVANADGTDARRVFDCADPCVWSDDPAWSPDGSSLAIAANSSDEGFTKGQVLVIELATGTTTTVHTAEIGNSTYIPRWSPDGTKLVFEVDSWEEPTIESEVQVGGSIQVVEVGTEESPATVLMEFDTLAGYPSWHPTEDLIVFQASSTSLDGPFDLFTIRSDGSDLTQLTEIAGTGFQAIQPTWSPDGEHVIFVYDQMWTNARLGIVSADGTMLTDGAEGLPNMTHPRLNPGS